MLETQVIAIRKNSRKIIHAVILKCNSSNQSIEANTERLLRKNGLSVDPKKDLEGAPPKLGGAQLLFFGVGFD